MKFQKFHLNRIKYLILILLSIVYLPSVRAIVNPTTDFYVNDYANILSSEIEEYIKNKSIALNNTDGTQIVVVTVPNLEGLTIEDYANKLFNNFGIGSEEKNNGLLLLLALEEREFRVEVGYGLEGILPDGKTGRFQDQYMIPYLSMNNWDDGIKNGYDAFYKEIVTLNNLNIDYNDPFTFEEESLETVESDGLPTLLFFLYLSGFIFSLCKSVWTLKPIKLKILIIPIIILGIYICILDITFTPAIIMLTFGYIYSFFGNFNIGSGSGSSSFNSFDSFSSRGSYRSSSRSSFRGGGGRSGGGGSSRRF